LRKGVEALSKICVDLDISVPVGKDSLSMKTKWSEDGNEKDRYKSPLSGVITAMAPVEDVSFGITPELTTECGSNLLFVKMNNKNRLAGSIFSEVSQEYFTDTPDVDNVTELKDLFNTIQSLVRDQKVLALHDISDGGTCIALAEMCFTKKVGMDISLPDINLNDINANLFSEEVGLVLQVPEEDSSKIESLLESKFTVANLGVLNNSKTLNISCQSGSVFSEPVEKLESKWREVSHAIQSMRDNSITADEEQNLPF
jgi:phosphoribosylformylglycinamidine synthase